MLRYLALGSALLIATACSDPPPAPKPVTVSNIAIPAAAVEDSDEVKVADAARAAADEAALARQLLALGTAPKAATAEQPAPAATHAAPRRRVARPPADAQGTDELARAEEPDNGTLSDAQFQATLGGWRGLKSCLALQTARDDASGALKVEFTISGRGEVVTSKVYEFSNDAAKDLADCVEREARRVKFPAFTAAESVVKQAKFVF